MKQMSLYLLTAAAIVALTAWLTPHGRAQEGAFHVCPAGPPTCDYASIQAAVDAAPVGATIKIATGDYTDLHARPAPPGYTGPNTVTQVVYITKPLSLLGGYTPTDWSIPDPVAHPTTLNAGNDGRVVLIVGEITTTIAGLRLTGGDASNLGGIPWSDAGGGLYVLSATVAISRCEIYGNRAGNTGFGVGGGLYLESAAATVTYNAIHDNIAATAGEGYGGGSEISAGVVTFTGNTVYGNIASTVDWGYGGGLELVATTATLDGNTIYSNTASTGDQGYGGGLNIVGGEPGNLLLTHNTIRGNIASTGYDGYGGGIAFDSSPAATLHGNLIRDNNASTVGWGYGGGGDLWKSDVGGSNNVFIGNIAGLAGSGLHIERSRLTLTHTTIAVNTGGDGSGLHVTGSQTALSVVTLTNTILTHQDTGITTTSGNAVIVTGILWYGNGANTGGTGTVQVNDDHIGDPAFAADGYHITASSAALDRGVSTAVSDDIDGQPRPVGAGPDLGADEWYPTCEPVSGLTITGPTIGLSGAPQTFTATVAPPIATLPITYIWRAAGQPPVTHTGGLGDNIGFTWTLTGTYRLTVTAANCGEIVTGRHTITITPPPQHPQVDFVGSPRTGDAPLTVHFTSTTTGTVSAYTWLFGDGGRSTLPHPTHTYSDPGEFGVTLVVTGPGGTASAAKPGYIHVTAPPGVPTATFGARPISGTAPLTVTFVATITPGTAVIPGWQWEFGDGGEAFTGPQVVHVYEPAGQFDVLLTISTAQGTYSVGRPGYIQVYERPYAAVVYLPLVLRER